MSTTSIIPPSHLDSHFSDMPGFPSIRQTSTASWPTVDSDFKPVVRRPPQLNKIYFNKKTLKETVKCYSQIMQQDVYEQIWEIPFSVDVEVPVTELTQRIQRVMTDRKIYRHWDIDFSHFVIVAKQVITEWDTIVK